jgi:hypothetical protein
LPLFSSGFSNRSSKNTIAIFAIRLYLSGVNFFSRRIKKVRVYASVWFLWQLYETALMKAIEVGRRRRREGITITG